MVREHFTAQGQPKQMFKTKAAADVKAAKRRQEDNPDYESYKCSMCPGWHVGRGK